MNIKYFKNKRLRRGRCFILALVILLGGFLFNSFSGEAEASGYGQAQYWQAITVSNNDSLWALVEQYCDFEGDIRKALYEVKQINGLNSALIFPGDTIYIPYSL